MGLPSGSEWIFVVIVVLIIFGPKNLPKIGRAIGQSIRGFKEEMKGITTEEDENSKNKTVKSTSTDESKK